MSDFYGFYYKGKNRNYYYDVYSGDLFYHRVYLCKEDDELMYIEFAPDMGFEDFKARCNKLESEANGLSK